MSLPRIVVARVSAQPYTFATVTRRRWLGLALIVILDAAIVWASGTPSTVNAGVSASAPVAARGWLHSDGARILDDQGRTVLLHGFNADALVDWTDYDHRSSPIDETDAAMMQAAGFDVVRLPISWARLEPERGRIDQGYIDRIQSTVAMLNRHGLWVVLDLHIGVAWGTRSGTPGWAQVPVVPDFKWFPNEPFRDSTSPAQLADLAYFWIGQDWKQEVYRAWRAVAERFKDAPGLAGYDLYNEPHPMPLPARNFERNFLFPFYAAAIGEIASVDPHHLFIVEATLFSVFPTWTEPVVAPNLVYSPHLYTGSLIESPFSSGPISKTIPKEVLDRQREAATIPAAMWVGEMGTDRSDRGARLFASTILDALDQAGVGWAWWQWRQWGNWGIRNPAGTAYDREYLRYLARPYMVAAPTGVRLIAADGVTGLLVASVTAGHAAGTLEVGWSSLTLGPPAVKGACVAGSAYDRVAGRLTITLAPDAGCELSLSQAANPLGP